MSWVFWLEGGTGMNQVLWNDVFLLEGTCLHIQQPFLWVASRLSSRTFPLESGKWAELFLFSGKKLS